MASFFLTKFMLTKLNQHNYHPFNEWSNQSELLNENTAKDRKDNVVLSTNMVCRVCTKSACTPLTEDIGDCDIISGIRKITNIEISVDDRFPKYICTECLETLKSALAFRQKCELTDKKFRKLCNPLNRSYQNAYPYSKHDFHLMLHQMKLKRIQALESREKKIKKKEKRLNKKRKKNVKQQKQYKCIPCNRVFGDQNKLQAHRRLRQCTRHPCDICGQLVLSITQHMRLIHNQNTIHKCQTCGKEFPIIARLRSHMLVHTNTFNFFCDLCPYKSKHKYYLVMHMRTHTGEKPYKCPQCPATFVNPSNLNKHKLTHQDKQFPCALCDKAFRTNAALREHHEAAHMNMKHACNYCGRNFCYKSDLRKHEIRYHNRIKRDYIGGEPTYKQVERLQKLQDNANDMDKWRQQALPAVNPIVHTNYLDQSKQYEQPHTLYTFTTADAVIHQQPHIMPDSTVALMPDLLKKDDPKLFQGQSGLGYF